MITIISSIITSIRILRFCLIIISIIQILSSRTIWETTTICIKLDRYSTFSSITIPWRIYRHQRYRFQHRSTQDRRILDGHQLYILTSYHIHTKIISLYYQFSIFIFQCFYLFHINFSCFSPFFISNFC